MSPLQLIELDVVDSTQDEVLDRLARAGAGAIAAVSARHQRDGRGRQGRRWMDAPGGGAALSVGARGPLQPRVLEDLPLRVAGCVLDLADAGDRLAWKAPNDLVARNGAKVAGILVDARTVGASVDHVVVGIGINLAGEPFLTDDGRAATTLEALDCELRIDELAARIAAELSERS